MGGAESCLACDSKRIENAHSNRIPVEHIKGPILSSAASVSAASTCESTRTNGEGGLAKVGIGAYFQRSVNDPKQLVVKSVLRGSPASVSGDVRVGDAIVSVNGSSVYGCSLAGLAEKLLGYAGTEVDVQFERRDTKDVYTVHVTRGINARP